MTPSLSLIITILSSLSVVSARFQCPGPGVWADPRSCTSFYQCLSPGTVYKYLCPPGTRYDPRVHNCNHNFLAPPCNKPAEDNTDDDSDSFVLPPSFTPEDSDELNEKPQYTVAAGSLYPCSKPGYFSEETSCNNFYVCKEVTPGILNAERVFRFVSANIFMK